MNFTVYRGLIFANKSPIFAKDAYIASIFVLYPIFLFVLVDLVALIV
jgi:hypothetical protein